MYDKTCYFHAFSGSTRNSGVRKELKSGLDFLIFEQFLGYTESMKKKFYFILTTGK